MGKCLVCPTYANIDLKSGTYYDVRCLQCGRYKVVDFTDGELLAKLDEEVKPRVSRWIHDQCALGTVPVLTAREIESLGNLKPLPFQERANRVLKHIAKQTKVYGEPFRLRADPEFFAIAETFKAEDAQFILQYLHDRKYVVSANDVKGTASVTGDGFKEVDRLNEARAEFFQGFVAMWFDPKMDAIRDEALYPAIEAAGYKPIRLKETEHNNKICDEIVAEIRRSRFVVADFTGKSCGVYYEAGFAAGLGIPVIFTCRKQGDDHDNLHFDVRQFNTIDWTDATDLRSKLTTRISATIGDGPHRK
jgi:hypothetical protein